MSIKLGFYPLMYFQVLSFIEYTSKIAYLKKQKHRKNTSVIINDYKQSREHVNM
jgi:hypothetical protein